MHKSYPILHEWQKPHSTKIAMNHEVGSPFLGPDKQPLMEKEIFFDQNGHVIVELANEVKGKVTRILYSALKNGYHTLMDILQTDGQIEFGEHDEVCKANVFFKNSP